MLGKMTTGTVVIIIILITAATVGDGKIIFY